MRIGGIYLIPGPSGRLNRIIVWRPRIVSNHKIMAKAIKQEEIAAKEAKRAFEPWNAIVGFHLRTGGLRLTNAGANLLLVEIAKVMEVEGASKFAWEPTNNTRDRLTKRTGRKH
jgi:hypothetical protein